MQETNNKKQFRFSDTAFASAFCNKYVIMGFVASILGAIAERGGYCHLIRSAEILLAALTLYLISFFRNAYLNKKGIPRSKRIENEKHLESRLSGSLADVKGIGTTMGVLSGVASAFADLYLINGGIFSGDELLMPIIYALGKALMIGSSIAMITSRDSLCCTLYITAVKNFDNDNALKNTARLSHYSKVIMILRGICSVRIIAVISLAVVILAVSLSGTGSPYTCFETALICLAVILLTDISPAAKDNERSSEKTDLKMMTKKNFCIVNIFAFVIISAAIVYTFPFKSVFTINSYEVEYVFEYQDEVSADIEYISVPEMNAENSGLFSALFASTISMAIVVTIFSNIKGYDFLGEISNKERLISITAAAVIMYLYIWGKANMIPDAVFSAVEWVVIIALMCLLLCVDLVYSLISSRTSKNAANNSNS